MARRPNLFLLVSEITVLLLGGLLIVLALTRTVGVPERPAVMAILGAVLLYWAVRQWSKPGDEATRRQTQVRAVSLAIVGLLVIAIPFASAGAANRLVMAAGTVLVVRGLLGGWLALALARAQ